jgi:hypothetical protein
MKSFFGEDGVWRYYYGLIMMNDPREIENCFQTVTNEEAVCQSRAVGRKKSY